MKRKTPWEKEWNILLRREAKFQSKRKDGPTMVLLMKLNRVIPKKLGEKLGLAFSKAFKMIFEKGTRLIEKTYNKKKREMDFKVNTYADELMQNTRSARKFIKAASGTKALNMLITFVEGTLMGIFGMAIPDIPLFLAMVLKSVYEVALSYGYDYHDEREKVLILKIIAVAMTDEEEFIRGDREVNEALDFIASHGDEIPEWSITKEEQLIQTSNALVKEMIYTKFIQQFMIIGFFGGIFDPVYVNRISKYAELKYRRRFLGAKIDGQEQN